MAALSGKVAWVTGAGTGIGEAASLGLAQEGAAVVISGRRRDKLQSVADRIAKAGGRAVVAPLDHADGKAVGEVAGRIRSEFKRLDILVNNAGANIPERQWSKLNPERIRTLLDANLTGTFLCTQAALEIMRPQKDGLLIHVSSWAGRFIGLTPGPAYIAAKHGVVAMSHATNLEEFVNGIRSTVICPNDVATPILDNRPVPVTPEQRARMIQPHHMADLILYVAKLPPAICLNEILISPTWNRSYASQHGLDN